MKTMSLYFDREGKDSFHKMSQVMMYSAKQVGIDVDLVIFDEVSGKRHHKHDNMIKFDAWYAYFHEQPYGAEILFVDSDVFFLRSVEHIFDKDFDIAITIRSVEKRPNTGVVFVRKNLRTERFFSDWYKTQHELWYDEERLEPLYTQYKGINQAALVETLKKSEINVLELPCKRYNSFKEDHLTVHDPEVSIVHCHFGDLRRVIFGLPPRVKSNKRRASRRQKLSDKWHEFYREAKNIELKDFEYKLKDVQITQKQKNGGAYAIANC